MSTFEFKGPISGQTQFGDGNTMNVSVAQSVTPDMVGRAVALRDQVLAEAPTLAEDAEALHGELVAAQRSGTAPDPTVMRPRLTRLMGGLAAGSVLLGMAEQLKQLLGL
jgi:hypothetical protein